jgi:hypothetical protein
LLELGKSGGILDAKDALEQGPVLLITESALSQNNPNNPTHTAGTTFMGQFMDHDMTFDLMSPLGQPTDPEDSTNTRTPAFDLDAVYGGGPSVDPELYERVELGHATNPSMWPLLSSPFEYFFVFSCPYTLSPDDAEALSRAYW